MKPVSSKVFVCAIIALLFIPQLVWAGTRTFVKEYAYQASEDDSRNSSRVIALREVKRLLLEELGTYLESQTEVRNFQLTKDQITTLTAGIVQTEILEEKWDGHTYRLKSKITADPDKVAQSLDDLRKDRDKTRELEAMKQKSDELMREVTRLKKEMAAKEGGRDAQKAAYDKSIKQLSAAEWIEKGHAMAGPDDHFQGALAAYGKAIELDPENIKAHYFRARVSEKNQALSDYYKLLTLPARTSEDHLVRAWTYKELNQRDAALREFTRAIETAAGNEGKAAAYFDRGRYYLLFRSMPYTTRPDSIPKALELAVNDFSSAIALGPTDPSYFHHRANAYLGLDKKELAIADFTAGIALDPKNAGLFSGRGQTYQLMRKPELAIADLSRAIELEGPDDLFAGLDFMMRADLYEDLGKFDLALKDWDTLVRRKEDDPYAYSSRADVYSKLGKYDLAIIDYGKSIALAPQGSSATMAHYGRALAYAAIGNSLMSIQDLRRALQLDPGYKAKARTEKRFDPLRNNSEFIRLTSE